MPVFVICSSKKCEGPGVSEYNDDYVAVKPVQEHYCGFCSHDVPPVEKKVEVETELDGEMQMVEQVVLEHQPPIRVPMRSATPKEVKAYLATKRSTLQDYFVEKQQRTLASIQEAARQLAESKLAESVLAKEEG